MPFGSIVRPGPPESGFSRFEGPLGPRSLHSGLEPKFRVPECVFRVHPWLPAIPRIQGNAVGFETGFPTVQCGRSADSSTAGAIRLFGRCSAPISQFSPLTF